MQDFVETRQELKDRIVDFFNYVCTVESKREAAGPVNSLLLQQNSSKQITGVTPTSHVLVASHGGALSSLFKHFETDYSCRLPGDCSKKITPNTALSLFIVHVSVRTNLCTNLVCLCMHNNTHLQ